MNTNTAKQFESLLKERLSPEEAGIERPDLLLVFEARQKVMSRKTPVRKSEDIFRMLMSFFQLELRFYHVGLSLLLISGGIFYLNEPNYDHHVHSGLSAYNDVLSINNSTVSVNSSTMLTSIPTLVIRN